MQKLLVFILNKCSLAMWNLFEIVRKHLIIYLLRLTSHQLQMLIMMSEKIWDYLRFVFIFHTLHWSPAFCPFYSNMISFFKIALNTRHSFDKKRDVANKTAVQLTVVDFRQTMGGSGSTPPLRVCSLNVRLHPQKKAVTCHGFFYLKTAQILTCFFFHL